ncbi:AAA family ATPase [Acetivibrio cellulolyticus]|uniref:AAA family ATPase n=1 Tax=Acetivibrio cellulolyticus TaxID=35830 RepID=UPI0001E2DE03|nr:AAA family ATPase [Acetivibrio cellulolyticus]
MNKFIMMVGLPGSGKSTLAKELALKENAALHSSDDLREELFGDANNQDNNELVFQELNRRINQDLSEGKSVVYDATNLSYKKRKLTLDRIKQECYKECILVATPYEKCLHQNNLRSRKVPETVIEKMYKSFLVPQYYEGWDNIKVEFNTDEDYDLAELFKELDVISQDNSHHTLTIGEHCKKCAEYIEEQHNDEILLMAALLHDIGKKFTKRFEDRTGNPTEEAHFYNHQNVSAYLSLFYLKHMPVEKILEITNLIQWHMQPFNIKTGKAKTKSTNLLGREAYDNLLRLHEADVRAK